ncbi:MAG: ABC transporter permease [Thermomicrobiales bacterium]|nr:ABC transporter permease [Thermomicrobiales bacterium]
METATAASRPPSAQRVLEAARDYGIYFVFIAVFFGMSIVEPKFRSEGNLVNLLRQNAVIGIMACGMTFAIVLGGFDLSVGAVAAASSVVCAKVIIHLVGNGSSHQWQIVVGVVAGILVGLLVGLINGLLISWVGVNPFVSTLGTMTILRGLLYVWTNATPLFGVPMSFTKLGLGSTFRIPNPFWVFLGVAIVATTILSRMRFGHYVYAIGGNAIAAARVGIDVRRVRLIVYMITAVCAAIAGIILVGQTATGQPAGALGYELTAIAAVIVGGASLAGGQGKMSGTIVGVFLLGVVSNALNLFGVSPFWQPVATGSILVVAVAIDSLAAKSSRSTG